MAQRKYLTVEKLGMHHYAVTVSEVYRSINRYRAAAFSEFAHFVYTRLRKP